MEASCQERGASQLEAVMPPRVEFLTFSNSLPQSGLNIQGISFE
jgi:hypothetical protein